MTHALVRLDLKGCFQILDSNTVSATTFTCVIHYFIFFSK